MTNQFNLKGAKRLLPQKDVCFHGQWSTNCHTWRWGGTPRQSLTHCHMSFSQVTSNGTLKHITIKSNPRIQTSSSMTQRTTNCYHAMTVTQKGSTQDKQMNGFMNQPLHLFTYWMKIDATRTNPLSDASALHARQPLVAHGPMHPQGGEPRWTQQ